MIILGNFGTGKLIGVKEHKVNMKVIMAEKNRVCLSRVVEKIGLRTAVNETRLNQHTLGRAVIGNPIHAATEKVLLEFITKHTQPAANAA